ncbi:MAG: VWA domain-containing protein [Vicinamibacterales bacterium]
MDLRSLCLAASVAVAASPTAGQDGARFVARSDLVVLHVTVTDRRGAYVGGLSRDSFRVFENGEERRLNFFLDRDLPATVGLILDSSGSMFAMRHHVATAVATFAAASHADDEFFAMTFNERVKRAMPPRQPFTSDPSLVRDAVTDNLGARGRTALFDAVSTGLDEVARGHRERQILILISDGGDNASTTTVEHVFDRAQRSNAVIYAVALVDPLVRDRNPKLLRQLATATGGLAFEPRDARGIGEALNRIARDIRSSYTLAYVPSGTAESDRWRRIRVETRSLNGRRVNVRTRTGYVATTDPQPQSETGER